VDTNELRQQRAKLITDARATIDAAAAEKRDLTAEEETNVARIMGDPAKGTAGEIDKLGAKINREEQLQKEERALEETQGRVTTPDPKDTPETRALGPRGSEEYRAAFQRYLRMGPAGISAQEARALQADDDVGGGYTVAPIQFAEGLLKELDDLVFIRSLATKTVLDRAESLGIVSLDADPADADWTTELATGGEDSTMGFGRRELRPHPLAKLLKVSATLLRQSRLDVEGLARSRLAYKFAVSEEKGFLVGSGAGQPLGVFTASAQGISTGRDISTGNTTTAIQADGLQEAKWGLKPAYRQRARWLFHSDALKQIAKLKDGDGQYIWQPGLQAGTPDRLLNQPYAESVFAPNTFTTGLYVGIFGDFSFYHIADALEMTVQRLVELYAATNQVGLIGRLECDGMPVLETAFVRVKLA